MMVVEYILCRRFILKLSTGGKTADVNKFIFLLLWLISRLSPSFVGLTEPLFGNDHVCPSTSIA